MKYTKYIALFMLASLSAFSQNERTPNEERLIKYYVQIDNVADFYTVSKFGHNDTVTTTLEPICLGGVYQTPTTAKSLEIVSDDSQDSASGTGARQVTVYGLGSDWKRLEETVIMNGTSPVTLTNQFTRVFRLRVAETGVYATQSQGSHEGEIVLRGIGGGDTWAIMGMQQGFATSSSQIGSYTIPEGWRAAVFSKAFTMDANKEVNFFMFKRERADEVPGGAMTLIEQNDAISVPFAFFPVVPIGPFEGPCDIGFMANTTSGTADVSVEFEIIVYKTGD